MGPSGAPIRSTCERIGERVGRRQNDRANSHNVSAQSAAHTPAAEQQRNGMLPPRGSGRMADPRTTEVHIQP